LHARSSSQNFLYVSFDFFPPNKFFDHALHIIYKKLISQSPKCLGYGKVSNRSPTLWMICRKNGATFQVKGMNFSLILIPELIMNNHRNQVAKFMHVNLFSLKFSRMTPTHIFLYKNWPLHQRLLVLTKIYMYTSPS